MISIIVCSINPEMAEAFSQNVSATIGVEYELLIHDNRGSNDGICKVYNQEAARAKYDYLLFAHEDILFNTPNWGSKIVSQLDSPGCGAIGFAGAVIKSKYYSGLGQLPRYNRSNYTQHYNDGTSRHFNNIEKSQLFSETLTLDGFAIFAKREVWASCKFDEELLTGFHGYDLDFSLQVSRNYINYVCNCVHVEHLSAGKHSGQWAEWTINLHDRKWSNMLPLMVEPLSSAQIVENERFQEFLFTKRIVKSDYKVAEHGAIVRDYLKRYGLCNGSLHILLKYLQNRLK